MTTYVNWVTSSTDFLKLSGFLLHNQIKHERVGSSLIPSVEHPGDYDILVLDTPDNKLEKVLAGDHWLTGGSNVPEASFTSYKKHLTSGLINVILTTDEEFFTKFSEANAICVEADLKHKYDRIRVYDYIFDRPDKPSDEVFSKLAQGISYEESPFPTGSWAF